MIILSIFLFRFIPLFLELVNKTNSKAELTQSFLMNNVTYNFTKNDHFVFAVALVDKKTDKIIDIGDYLSLNLTDKPTNKKFKMEPCKNITSEELGNYDDDEDIENFYCPNLIEEKFNLKKTKSRKGLNLQVYFNDPDNKYQKEFLENITNNKQRYKLLIYYKRVLFDPENYANPFNYRIEHKSIPMQWNNSKGYFFNFQKYETKTDDSPFFEVENKKFEIGSTGLFFGNVPVSRYT